MRTTLTIDDDVYKRLEERLKTRNSSFKELVNEALRESLFKDIKQQTPPHFELKTFNLGHVSLSSVDNVAEVLATLERDDYK